MTLDKASVNKTSVITQIKGTDELKQRLYSFGIIEGSFIELKNISLAKQTIQITNEDGTLIALRLSEAKNIEVLNDTN